MVDRKKEVRKKDVRKGGRKLLSIARKGFVLTLLLQMSFAAVSPIIKY